MSAIPRSLFLFLSLASLAAAQSAPLHDCSVAGRAARCGEIRVPENRAAPGGRTIALNVVVIPASGVPATAAIVELPGGPGQAATRDVQSSLDDFGDLLRTRDLLLVDQRGTGQSNSARCSAGRGAAELTAWLTLSFPRDSVSACVKRFAGDLTRYTTTEAADDLEDVRRTLGYEWLDLVGVSYGTRLALEYVRRHPQHARTAVVRGVSPAGSRLPLFVARDAQAALEQRAADCLTREICKDFTVNLTASVARALDSLNDRPRRLSLGSLAAGAADTLLVTRDVAAGAVTLATYAQSSPDGLAMAAASALHGNYNLLVGPGVLATRGVSGTVDLGAYLSVVCAEDVPEIQASEIAAQTRGTFLGDMFVRGLVQSCAAWPRAAISRAFFAPVVSAVPTLVVSGEVDPVTPPRWGDSVVVGLRRGRKLLLRGVGHIPAWTLCARTAMVAFIATAGEAEIAAECAKPAMPAVTFGLGGATPGGSQATWNVTGVWDTYWQSQSGAGETKSGGFTLCQRAGRADVSGSLTGQGSLEVSGTIDGASLTLTGRNVVEFTLAALMVNGELRGRLRAATIDRAFVARRRPGASPPLCLP